MTTEEFGQLMQRELYSNTSKGVWQHWKPDAAQAVSELMVHVGKLCVAVWLVDRSKVNEHAADVGNMAMKIVELFGRKV